MPPFNGLFRTDCVVVPVRTERWGKHLTNAVGRLDPAGNTIRAKETQMADNNRLRRWLCAVAGAASLAVSAAIAPTASAQGTGPEIKSDGGKWIDMRRSLITHC